MKTIKTIITTVLMLSVFLTGCANGSVSEDTLNQSGDLSEIPEVFIVPDEQYVIKCLKQVDTINGIAAVTEDNDPNGKLNEKGGYISAVYFSSSLIQNNKFSERQLIEEGTSAGGCIEVFSTVEDANKRNEYLSEFDGGLFESGSHTVIGTVVVRLSNELDDTQQEKLEKDIIDNFIAFNNNSVITKQESSKDYVNEKSTQLTDVKITNDKTTQKTETTSRENVTTTKKAETTTKKNNSTPSLTTTQVANTRYVLNTNSLIFHYGTCRHAKKIVPENRIETNQSRDDVVAKGYRACGVCKP